MSRKTRLFRELLEYISKPAEKGPLWLHNISTGPADRGSALWQLEENARLLRRRRNGNVLYHEILSFSSEDGHLVDSAVTESVTRYYLELRAPYALAVARAHYDTGCPHVHLVISANDLGSRDRLRISRQRFEEIKVRLAAFVRTRFPGLARSGEHLFQKNIDAPTGERLRESAPESERRRRGEIRPTRKQEIRDQIARVLAAAKSAEDCYCQLLSEGLRLYKRGSSIGVEEMQVSAGRKYRLTTLGLDQRFERARRDWIARAQNYSRELDAGRDR